MAKARLMVQEPENTLLTAPTRMCEAGSVHIITKLRTTLRVNGQERSMIQPEDGIVGFMVVFDDYEKALKWVDGDTSVIMTGHRQK